MKRFKTRAYEGGGGGGGSVEVVALVGVGGRGVGVGGSGCPGGGREENNRCLYRGPQLQTGQWTPTSNRPNVYLFYCN